MIANSSDGGKSIKQDALYLFIRSIKRDFSIITSMLNINRSVGVCIRNIPINMVKFIAYSPSLKTTSKKKTDTQNFID